MNIVEIYCNANPKNKKFLDKAVKILLKNETHLFGQDLKDKAKQIEEALAKDFSRNNPDWICEECGAPVVCDYITSYYEHYTCVGEVEHVFTAS